MQLSSPDIENDLYSYLVPATGQMVAETKYPYLYWTERHLQVMWWEQKYFKHLKTSSNLPIEVISPGIWNAEAGPDFLKAHLKIGDQVLKGDIEIHLNDENWFQHKHHQDGRYDNVILHVSLWNAQNEKKIVNSRGREIYQTHLESFLTISQARILQLIDLEQYPYRKFLGSGQCAHTLYPSLSEEKIFHLFESAAEWRLKQKVQYLKGHIEDPRLLLPSGIAMALGYKKNSEAFFELFLRLLKYQDKSEKELLSLALGICGFFSDKHQIKWKESSFYQELLQLHNSQNLSTPYYIPLQLHQIRPFNHPIRRIAYLVKLIKDPLMTSLYPEIASCWHYHWPQSHLKNDWNSLKELLTERLPTYVDLYWRFHYTFETEPQTQPLSLFGNDLREIILVNTILPLLYMDILKNGNLSEIEAFRNFYRSLQTNYNRKTRYLSHRFFGDSQRTKILDKAMAQQGAFQIHKDFCLHYEASCEGCTFVERYKERNSS